jgi:hypothetical protein
LIDQSIMRRLDPFIGVLFGTHCELYRTDANTLVLDASPHRGTTLRRRHW